jgi:hypothetical protein
MKVEVCPHEKLKVTREWARDGRGRSFLKPQIKRGFDELAYECVNYHMDIQYEASECIEIHRCGCLLNVTYDYFCNDAYIIPSDYALEYLRERTRQSKRFEYLYKKYQRLFRLVG